MGDVQPAVDERQDSEDEGDRGAQTRTKQREHRDRTDADDERKHERERVLSQIHAGLSVQDGIVERVHEHDGGRAAEDHSLDAPPAAQRSALSWRLLGRRGSSSKRRVSCASTTA